MIRHLWAAAAALLLTVGCGGSEDKAAAPAAGSAEDSKELKKVSVVLNWFPEAEHGGYFTAQVEGYFKAEGLDVTLVPGGVDVQPITRVATGREDFAVANGDQVVFGRAEGAKVLALLAPLQVSPRCIMVHAESNIQNLEDLQGIKLAMNPNDAFSLFLRKNFPLKDVQVVPYTGNVALFLNDKSFAQQAYNISEPFVAKKQGAKPVTLMLSDAGYDPYVSCLITTEEYLARNRDVVAGMVRASLKGWQKYMQDPKATNEAINKANPEMGMDILQFGVDTMQDMVFTPEAKEKGLGVMTQARWDKFLATMEEIEAIKPGAVKASECWTAEFLPKP